MPSLSPCLAVPYATKYSKQTDRHYTDPRQQLYYLNLTSAFSLADDGKTAIQSTPKLDGNVGINFKDGFMLANDYEFIVYGGFMDYMNNDSLIGPTWSQARDMVQHGEVPLRDAPKYRTFALDGVTRYIAAGGSVSVPSENKAYVFSGETVSQEIVHSKIRFYI